MARHARLVIPGIPHHVTQRGNQRRQMFFDDADYRGYLALLRDLAGLYGVRVRGYCLMPNHAHLVPVPGMAASLAMLIGRVNQRYSQQLNYREGSSGHRWQNRFFSCPLDEAHCARALRYLERNPVRAGLVTTPWDYPWSSAAAHCTGSDPTGLLDLTGWTDDYPDGCWRDILQTADLPGEVEAMRFATNTGRPLGSDAFIAHLEAQTGRPLQAKPVGRPRKTPEPVDEGK